MKLVWKGKYSGEEQLGIVNLPDNAVRFREPETPGKLNLIACLYVIPVMILVWAAIIIKNKLGLSDNFIYVFDAWGILLAFLTVIPHELLHALAFPKHAEVQVWYSPKNLMAFVYSTYPTSKWRFIFISLLPNIIFGFIPLVTWIFIPSSTLGGSGTLFIYAVFSLMMGAGDYMNVFNALVQMPGNSTTQLSGFHSYWYISRDEKLG